MAERKPLIIRLGSAVKITLVPAFLKKMLQLHHPLRIDIRNFPFGRNQSLQSRWIGVWGLVSAGSNSTENCALEKKRFQNTTCLVFPQGRADRSSQIESLNESQPRPGPDPCRLNQESHLDALEHLGHRIQFSELASRPRARPVLRRSWRRISALHTGTCEARGFFTALPQPTANC